MRSMKWKLQKMDLRYLERSTVRKNSGRNLRSGRVNGISLGRLKSNFRNQRKTVSRTLKESSKFSIIDM